MQKKQSLKDITEEINYLKPYLARLGNPSELSEAEAYLIQYACIRDYKQLLVRRANKILHEFEKYSQELVKMQALILQVKFYFLSYIYLIYVYKM